MLTTENMEEEEEEGDRFATKDDKDVGQLVLPYKVFYVVLHGVVIGLVKWYHTKKAALLALHRQSTYDRN